jgi:tetratricopeptide (TPR) repeat protein
LLEAGLRGSAEADTLDEVPEQRYASTTGQSTEQAPTRRFGEYELLAEIARGGQGVVYRARHRSLNRLVALKMLILGPWATEAHLKRFKTEAEAAANLDHPQIVPIYEIGRVEGQHYFTMKLVEGPSLKQLVISGPLAPRRAAEVLAGAARAIHHAHERGILHRDLKPGNILLDEHGQPQVTDFGLAKLVEDESTVTNTMDVLGTPSYLSPEQATGQAKSMTKACDIYGLGAVFYELLTGNPPFAGGTTMETLRQVVEREPRRPSFWNPKLDRELETICLKCLQKDPHLRYVSAAALADDLERWLRHEPISARPSGVFTRARKLVRRHPVAAVSIPLATALGAALVLMVWRELSRKESPIGADRAALQRLREEAQNSHRLEAELRLALANDRRNWPEDARKWRESINKLAGFLKAERRLRDAVEVYNSVLTPTVAGRRENASFLEARAELLARQGKWKQAASDFAQLVEYHPTHSAHYHQLAPLLVAIGDTDGYHRLCQGIVTHFGATRNSSEADTVAKCCLILPPTDIDLAVIGNLAATVIDVGTNNEFLDFGQFSTGLAEYRQGHFDGAVEWMRRVLRNDGHPWDDLVHFEANMVLAMADYRLNKTNEARLALAEGEALAEKKLPHLDAEDLAPGWSAGWIDLLIGHALMKEAKELIEAGQAEGNQRN